ncbi:hypothetical protein OOU_Y34scaffold00073g5 [Pyricularia oryzae Y34]|uniref:Uncharacterized protein n=1 Tax=Pyricularia oryzae (strain Y34) TaxID=1143189 RepID=A0AA97P9H2_PYRO3|nr:hypothetical protein OOU_Y34scaffold00073g5 [Pyricularia oryzae Y34]
MEAKSCLSTENGDEVLLQSTLSWAVLSPQPHAARALALALWIYLVPVTLIWTLYMTNFPRSRAGKTNKGRSSLNEAYIHTYILTWCWISKQTLMQTVLDNFTKDQPQADGLFCIIPYIGKDKRPCQDAEAWQFGTWGLVPALYQVNPRGFKQLTDCR